LKGDKQMCTFKLNLLRDKAAVATSINNHSTFHSFDSLENRLFNLTYQIFELEANEKDRKKSQLRALTASDEIVEDKICTGLKSSLSLIVRLDALSEDISRFKFKLEVQEVSKNSGGNVGGDKVIVRVLIYSLTSLTQFFLQAAPAQGGPSSSSNDKPTAKKAKTQPKPKNPAVPDPKVRRSLICQSHPRRSTRHPRDIPMLSL
jgi:hypothetical protein